MNLRKNQIARYAVLAFIALVSLALISQQALAASALLVTVDNPTAGESTGAQFEITADSTESGSALNSIRFANPTDGQDWSNVGDGDIADVGIDNDSDGQIEQSVLDDLSSVSTANSGANATLGFGGSYNLETGDVVIVNVSGDIQNPDAAGNYTVDATLNHQTDSTLASSTYEIESAPTGTINWDTNVSDGTAPADLAGNYSITVFNASDGVLASQTVEASALPGTLSNVSTDADHARIVPSYNGAPDTTTTTKDIGLNISDGETVNITATQYVAVDVQFNFTQERGGTVYLDSGDDFGTYSADNFSNVSFVNDTAWDTDTVTAYFFDTEQSDPANNTENATHTKTFTVDSSAVNADGVQVVEVDYSATGGGGVTDSHFITLPDVVPNFVADPVEHFLDGLERGYNNLMQAGANPFKTLTDGAGDMFQGAIDAVQNALNYNGGGSTTTAAV